MSQSDCMLLLSLYLKQICIRLRCGRLYDIAPQADFLFILRRIYWIQWVSTGLSGHHQASWLHQSICLQSCMSQLKTQEGKRRREGEQSWGALNYLTIYLLLFIQNLSGCKQSFQILNIGNGGAVTNPPHSVLPSSVLKNMYTSKICEKKQTRVWKDEKKKWTTHGHSIFASDLTGIQRVSKSF